mmetsp:Transcript_10725/g.15689  ORF Transcript_10725/g.15689 Transcript_10725/m.15689 type:complete len:262 (-) Transcript_10725:145-930(-)
MNQLHQAAINGDAAKIQMLLYKNVYPVNCRSYQYATPLHYAVMNEHVECVSVLLSYGASASSVDGHSSSPLTYAISLNSLPISRALIDAGASINKSHLLSSMKHGFKSLFTFLFSSFKFEDKQPFQFVLHHAISFFTDACSTTSDDPFYLDFLISLLDSHFSLDLLSFYEPDDFIEFDDFGSHFSSLHVAASSNNVSILSYLISKFDLSLDSVDYHGCSPLHSACFKCCLSSVGLLLSNGASIHLSTAHHQSPLHCVLLSS